MRSITKSLHSSSGGYIRSTAEQIAKLCAHHGNVLLQVEGSTRLVDTLNRLGPKHYPSAGEGIRPFRKPLANGIKSNGTPNHIKLDLTPFLTGTISRILNSPISKTQEKTLLAHIVYALRYAQPAADLANANTVNNCENQIIAKLMALNISLTGVSPWEPDGDRLSALDRSYQEGR